jgi:hypothetical protein
MNRARREPGLGAWDLGLGTPRERRLGPERRNGKRVPSLFQPPAPSPDTLRDYQSNFAPKRASRGETIVTGWRKVAPDAQLMFDEGLALVRL